jgi:hypothetical protein
MRFKHLIKFIFPVGILIFGVMPFLTITYMASADMVNLKIETSPASGFMSVNHMAPGDEEEAMLLVKNTGDVNFAYTLSARKKAGSDALFDLLLLKIKDGETVIADTYLNSLNRLSLGELAVDGSKEYTFIVKMPVEAGNELQGSSIEVAFDFTAQVQGEEHEPPVQLPVKDVPERTKAPEVPPTPDQPAIPNPIETDQPAEPALPPATDAQPEHPEDTPVGDRPTSAEPPGIDLPDTSSPWYNMLFMGIIAFFASLLVLWGMFKKKWGKS